MAWLCLFYYLMTDGGVFECFLDAFHRNRQDAFGYFGLGAFDTSRVKHFGCGEGYANLHVFREVLGL